MNRMRGSEKTVKTLRFMANPVAKRIASVYLIIVLRVVCMILLLLAAIILTLACMLRPWRLNIFRGDEMEIGVWTICRITKKFYQCYDNWYNEHYEHWFMAFRYMMVTAIVIWYVTFGYMCFELTRRKGFDVPWMRACFGCAFGGFFQFCSFVMFYYKFEWEFAEPTFGWPIMGWNEETPDTDGYVETHGFPYIMAWVAEVIAFFTAYLCFYTRCQEIVHVKEMKKQKENEMKLMIADKIKDMH